MDLYGPSNLENRMRGILAALVALNAVVMVFLARDVRPDDVFTLRFTAGIFLLLFVCLHGWFRYGWPTMIIFFSITAAVAWIVESVGISKGFPFGRFYYAETLGVKIGEVPLMILPAYFFNGYLAWTLADLLTGGKETVMKRKQVILVPLLAALFMVFWNMSFEPVMSTIEGHWTWEGGTWNGVPLANYSGWFLTSVLFFLSFAVFLVKFGDKFSSWRNNPLNSGHWYLFPVMYVVQGLPGLLHPLLRTGHTEIYYQVALITALTMLPVAAGTAVVIKRDTRGRFSCVKLAHENRPRVSRVSHGSTKNVEKSG